MPLDSRQVSRLAYAERWLHRARKDYDAFKKLTPYSSQTYKSACSSDSALAVYLLQQSIEKVVKAAALASGKYSPTRIRKGFSHNSLALLLDFCLKVFSHLRKLDITWALALFGFTIEDAEKKLRKVKREALRKEDAQKMGLPYVEQFAKASPDEILVALTLVQFIRDGIVLKTVREVWGPHSKIKLKSADINIGSAEEIINSFQTIWTTKFGRPPLTDDELTKISLIPKLAESLGIRIKGEDEPDSTITLSRNTKEYLGMWSIVALLILAAYTFPHESSSRYPSLRTKNKQATNIKELGCEDYTGELGIVKHIGYFGYMTGLVLDDMKSMLGPIRSFFAIKNPGNSAGITGT